MVLRNINRFVPLFLVSVAFFLGCVANTETGNSKQVSNSSIQHESENLSKQASMDSKSDSSLDSDISDDTSDEEADESPDLSNRELSIERTPDLYYKGKRCTVDCSGHEAGYKWAERKGITDPDDCGGNSQSFIEGCKSYAEENY